MDTKAYAWNLLKNASDVIAALGSLDNIVPFYPKEFNNLPVVAFSEISSRDIRWFSNSVFAVESTIQIDIFAAADTQTIADLIKAHFNAALYTMDFSQDVPNTDDSILHRVMRLRRAFTAGDL